MTPNSGETVVVLTTLPSAGQASALVRTLVERRLVACGTVSGEVRSIYRWKGEVEEAAEVQVLLKTAKNRLDAVLRAVQEEHPYDVPEVIALPVVGGLESYLSWIGVETNEEEGVGP